MSNLVRHATREISEGFFDLPNLIRDEAVEDPSGSSTLVAQKGGVGIPMDFPGQRSRSIITGGNNRTLILVE
jgi:hypothetical protein